MEINYFLKLAFVPNDPDLTDPELSFYNWYLDQIDVYEAWDITRGDDNVLVAVIDDAFSWDNTDLSDQNGFGSFYQNPGEDGWGNNPLGGDGVDGIDGTSVNDPLEHIDDWKGIDLFEHFEGQPDFSIIDNDVRPETSYPNYPDHDVSWHGTAMCGLIAAKTNNSVYGAGIAGGDILNGQSGVKILPIKIGDWDYEIFPYPHWEDGLSVNYLSAAIEYAVAFGAKVINMSFLGPTGQAQVDAKDAIDDAYLFHNVVFVGSTGNEGDGMIRFPGNYQYVIAVGGTDQDDESWYNPATGEGTNCDDEVALVAPAVDIYALTYDSEIGMYGTSASTAMVTATVGLMLSVNPQLQNYEIRDILTSTAEKVGSATYNNGWNDCMGYGRLNVCKAVSKALKYNSAVENINDPNNLIVTWNEPKIVCHDVYIWPNNTLIIKNTVRMGTYYDQNDVEHKAKIIVMRGEDNPGTLYDKSAGTLIIDGGKLTNLENCDDPDVLWGGIEVWGRSNYLNPSLSKSQLRQDGIYWQGKIILKNEAIIENAEIGILLGKSTGINSYDDYYAGGIIEVINNGDPDEPCAEFINNKTSVHFRPYKNFIPNSIPTVYTDNLGNLNNCFFDLNSNYLGGEWQQEHIYLLSVNGVKIKGCTFEYNIPNSQLGHGINAWGSGFTVDAICNSQALPCPPRDLDKSYFKNFYKGINLISAGSYTITTKNAEFTNNVRGISLENVNHATILFNNFRLGKIPDDDDGCDALESYGIDMLACTGFAIEENYFSKVLGAGGGILVGIRVNNCPSRHDIIYKNQFNGLSYGNYAQGVNRLDPNDDQDGVEYQCNLNTNNSVDFIVTADLPQYAKIRTDQGSPSLASGNTFSSSAAWHYRNEGLEKIDYYFWNGIQNEIPDMQRVYSIGGLYFDDHEVNNNTCPSHYGSGGGGTGGRTLLTDEEKLEREQSFYQNLSDYQSVTALFENLKDGGNTEALQDEVATSWPGDIWELRAELLGKSPHLSKEVLMTAADKTDVLPESVLFEILSANPDELKEADLIKYLEDKEQPLPHYMIEILQQLSFGVTYKTILKRQIAGYHAGKTKAALDIIRSILTDTITDMQQYRNWLDNLGGIQADKQIIDSYLSEGYYTDAQTLLNLMPTLYELDGQALMDYNDYKSLMLMQVDLEQQGSNICELDSAEIAVLVDYAENSSGEAKYMARGILNFAYGFNYCDCIVNSDSSFMKSSKAFPSKSFDMMFGLEVTVKPNPAGEWTSFNYKLPYNSTEGIIEITDVSGALIERFTVTGKEGQKVWDTRNIKSGVYFYTINVSGNNKSGKIVICK
jgi:hypothetical protein